MICHRLFAIGNKRGEGEMLTTDNGRFDQVCLKNAADAPQAPEPTLQGALQLTFSILPLRDSDLGAIKIRRREQFVAARQLLLIFESRA
jgi:hypothetical protein